MKTGLHGHVHARPSPSLRGGFNGWEGEPDVHGMVDKEVVRTLLDQDIDGLHLLLSLIDGLHLLLSLINGLHLLLSQARCCGTSMTLFFATKQDRL